MPAKSDGPANPSVLGWLAFGAAFLMAGLANLPSPYGNSFGIHYGGGAYGFLGSTTFYTLAIVVGGLGLLFAGYLALKGGHQYKGSAWILYGLFWLAYPTAGAAGNPAYSMAALMFIFLLITLTFLISSMKHGWGTFFVFLLTFVAFILWTVQMWQLAPTSTLPGSFSSGESWALGALLILTGFAAWYGATAELTNQTYGRKILPM
jgi:uncharacterized protein